VAPVASFKPNAFGLFDAEGNVSEWVTDCWSEVPGAPAARQPNTRCHERAIRGGNWILRYEDQRIAHRAKDDPDTRDLRWSAFARSAICE
jgi:formylglycine-generating enzyme required for sulfatase activity